MVGIWGGIYDPHRGVTDRLARSPVSDVYYPHSGVMWGCCSPGSLAAFAFLLDPTAYASSFLCSFLRHALLVPTMDQKEITELSADEVETLMSDIQRQMAQHTVSPTIESSGGDDQPALSNSTVFARSREITSNHSSDQNVEPLPLLPAFMAEHKQCGRGNQAGQFVAHAAGWPSCGAFYAF